MLVDRTQFDNPVYAIQGNDKVREDDSLLLNKPNVILNNLTKRINTNLERQRMALAGCSTDEDGSAIECSLITNKSI